MKDKEMEVSIWFGRLKKIIFTNDMIESSDVKLPYVILYIPVRVIELNYALATDAKTKSMAEAVYILFYK